MKLDLLTNATVVDDGIRFVSEKQKSLPKNKSKSELRATRRITSTDINNQIF
jgi:hypothetical protein